MKLCSSGKQTNNNLVLFNIYNSGEYLKIYGTYNYQNYLKGEQPSEVK